MNKTELELLAGYRIYEASIKAERTTHVVTLNPNSANPGEILSINIPKLKADSCLVPVHLLFDFVVSNTKTTFLNNLSSLLQNRFQIKLAGTAV